MEVIGNKEVLADGTDDVQLLVTVVDSTGRDLSNNVPVDLCVTKGPGEFPTGKSICFQCQQRHSDSRRESCHFCCVHTILVNAS